MYETDIRIRVNVWAKENAKEDYYYGAPYSYYREALYNGIISKEEYDFMESLMGYLWTYRGD